MTIDAVCGVITRGCSLTEILPKGTYFVVLGVTVDGIANSKFLWFYSILGLFRVSFEYLDVDFQSYCLQHLTVSTVVLSPFALSVS